MVWGGIAYGERTQLVVLNFQDNGPGRGLTARRYIDQVLRPHVVPFFAQHPGYLFQQDNARAHSAFSYSELSSSQWNSCTELASPLPRSRSHRASLGRVGETYPQPTKTAYERQRTPSRVTSRMEQGAAGIYQ